MTRRGGKNEQMRYIKLKLKYNKNLRLLLLVIERSISRIVFVCLIIKVLYTGVRFNEPNFMKITIIIGSEMACLKYKTYVAILISSLK